MDIEPNAGVVAQAAGARRRRRRDARDHPRSAEAVDGAHAVYTDVWASMGQENEKARAPRAFRALPGERGAVRAGRPDAVFMHCLPAKRGEEVTDEVIESPQSVVFDQAENRLHAQKALLLMLLRALARETSTLAGSSQ